MKYRTERPLGCANRGWSVAVLVALGSSLGQVAEAQVVEVQGGGGKRRQGFRMYPLQWGLILQKGEERDTPVFGSLF